MYILLIRYEIDLESQVWFQTVIAWHEVQLPFYYSHFEITKFSRYQNFNDLVAGLLKSGNQKAFYISFCIQNKSDAI